MIKRETNTVAAWAPWSDERPITEAAKLAAAWLNDQARERSLSPLLVTVDQSCWHSGGPDVVRRWAKYDGTSLRGKGPSRKGPHAVMCYAPNYKAVVHGLRHANGGAFAVVEWPSDRMIGWAMAAQATNLLTGETAPRFDKETEELLDFISFNGNNGWATGYGLNNAIGALERFGWIEPNLVCGFMLAKGHHAESAERLRRVIQTRSARWDGTVRR